MSKQKKYILSGGLAFSEEKDMKKLNKYSKQGYHLIKNNGLFYVLEKGEPKEYIYSVDYQHLKADELNDYLQIINECGWELVQHLENILFLRAPKGTAPLYTDKQTLSLREKSGSNQIGKSLISLILIILALLAWTLFIVPIIGIEIIAFLSTIITFALIGFTFTLFIGYLMTIVRSKKHLK